MANVQKQFEEFHQGIRTDFDTADELREKRDIVVEKIRRHQKEQDLPQPTLLHQGSYIMKTGVKPIAQLEYDIDVGLRFWISNDDYTASEVRGWVLEAVKDHTKRVEDKRPCIRVAYVDGYHLDLVAYAVEESSGADVFSLAYKEAGWRPADPPSLLQYVNDYRVAFEATEDSATKTDQFRRVIRCLRRWDDVAMPKESRDKPSGLGFVLLAIQQKLVPTTFDDGKADDCGALQNLCETIGLIQNRIIAAKPTPEYEDMFGRISDLGMDTLKERFNKLTDALTYAGTAADPVKACERLREEFGDAFPVPDPADGAKKTAAPAIITSSASA